VSNISHGSGHGRQHSWCRNRSIRQRTGWSAGYRHESANQFSQKNSDKRSGEYVVSSLPIGTYRVASEVTGFRTAIESPIELTVKARVRVDFTMQTGVVDQAVEVTSSAPLLKTDTSEVSTLVTRKELEALP
jgi:hypothetical protein